MKCMHICTIIIVINLCAIITVMYSYANNLPFKGGDRPNRSNFAILKIGIRYLAQICSRVKEKKKKVEMTLFALVTAAILDF